MKRTLSTCLIAFLSAAFFSLPPAAIAADQKGKAVVLWISIDGCRGDYVDRGQTPFLKSLMEHGEYTQHLVPIFPSLTFPSHTSEATGVAAGVHGIVSNKFYDTRIGQEYNLPGDPSLLQAEPIWATAARQGVRTAVWDWPLSQDQTRLPAGSARASVFDSSDKFDADATDEQRLEKLVDAYRKDCENPDNKQPLQLLMGYAYAIDHAGHGDGPESEKTTEAAHQVDSLLKKVVGEISDIFRQHMHPNQGDALYVLITTDHGMDTIKTLVNLKRLMGRGDVAAPDPVRADWAGSLANIYLNNVPGAEREEVKASILENLRKAPYLKCWAREELPENFAYANSTRTGDIVVSLDPGYYFTRNDIPGPVPVESEARSLKGMHGYDPALDDKMQGLMVLARYGSDQPGKDLGKIDTLRIHPTVAKLLGVQPASGAKEPPLGVPQ
ncbi:MAG TPA: nucleotide pyrophosphatase/phosphodiesterase family protein [Pirellulales bacterium]|jgi:predicted AlkP superfamily pyrophosphatase or phosphodiesterase